MDRFSLLLGVVISGVMLLRAWPQGMHEERGRALLHRMIPLSECVGQSCTYFAVAEIDRFTTLRRDIGFKLANELLRHLSIRIDAALDGCTVGRIGRTTIEFSFRAKDADGAATALDAVIKALDRSVTVDGNRFDLSISIGFTTTADCTSFDEMLDRSAAALTDGRAEHQRVRLADQGGQVNQSLDDLALMRDLPDAIANDTLQLYYQPKLKTRTNRIEAAEALLRWHHPTRGAVSTERLIALAESTGAIRALTRWVIDRAIRDQRLFIEAGHDLTIDVNISGLLLPDREFAAEALACVGTASGKIGFEITETAVIHDPDGSLANLRAFAAADIRIAIDDYGSGLSSLAYLKELPANELKIDRMFVSSLADSHRDPLLVRSSIDLAHALDMEVTAEGVDNVLSLSLLRVMGCDMVQGYLISPPLPVSELIHFLASDDALSGMLPPTIETLQHWRAAVAGGDAAIRP